MRVKLCGLTRAEDVEAAIEAGADALGFVFDHGSRCLQAVQARSLLEVARSASSEVECIAVTGQLPFEDVLPLATLGFDGIQAGVLPWQPELAELGPYLLPAFFDSPDLMQRVDRHVATHPLRTGALEEHSLAGCLNLDAASGGGTGELADWRRAAAVCATWPALVAGGLNPDNVADAISATRPAGVDVCSGIESAPGIKDAGAMRAFVQAAKAR